MLTVITPAPDEQRALLGLSDVKDELSISGDADDGRLTRYLRSATARLAAYANRDTFALEKVTETFRIPAYQPRIMLTRRPLVEVVAITLDGAPVEGWEAEGRFLYRVADGLRTCWTSGSWAVTYRAGYDLPGSAPADLADACMTLVKMQWFARTRDPLLKSQTVEGIGTDAWWIGGVSGSDGGRASLPPDMAAALYGYRFE
ncbi:phage head-tail connector protein [Azospirillum doebereinerae]|uniref:phage head-tail connector protein n=1 Tax=Azospirillum doebereinerae TaxID=92933 RepID=UPI001EE52DE7|nr:phage head-tail connector protein [Azospirillum doebereinerae]MCG5239530.1 phage head-tail connector protein [Azospirillum doebereinerae]